MKNLKIFSTAKNKQKNQLQKILKNKSTMSRNNFNFSSNTTVLQARQANTYCEREMEINKAIYSCGNIMQEK